MKHIGLLILMILAFNFWDLFFAKKSVFLGEVDEWYIPSLAAFVMWLFLEAGFWTVFLFF